MTAAPLLRVACEHGRYETHGDWVVEPSGYAHNSDQPTCPGGRMLEQAIIIERDTDGNWPDSAVMHMAMELDGNDDEIVKVCEAMLDALAKAQESQ